MQLTIKDLRQQGYKVKVLHFRRPQNLVDFHARGGSTTIELITPDKMITVTGKSICCLEDNYNRKVGADIALGRAIKELEVKLQKDLA